MLHATLNEYQTSFQLENPVHFLSQDDQRLTYTKLNPNIPNEYFSTRKRRGRARKLEVKQSWDENISSFSTNIKTSGSDVKSTTTSQPYGLLTPRTPTSSIVVGKDTEPETDWGNMYRSYSGDSDDGIGNRIL
jgi:hypothetical protein